MGSEMCIRDRIHGTRSSPASSPALRSPSVAVPRPPQAPVSCAAFCSVSLRVCIAHTLLTSGVGVLMQRLLAENNKPVRISCGSPSDCSHHVRALPTHSAAPKRPLRLRSRQRRPRPDLHSLFFCATGHRCSIRVVPCKKVFPTSPRWHMLSTVLHTVVMRVFLARRWAWVPR